MNKSELIESIASKAGLSKADAGKALDALVDTVEQVVAKQGDTLTLVGFGAFSRKSKPARDGRNPATGEAIKIKARNVINFKAGSKLLEKAN